MNNEIMRLKNLQEKIEILHKNNVMINENKYGCHINLTKTTIEVIQEIKTCF